MGGVFGLMATAAMAFARQRSTEGAGAAPRGTVSEPAMQRGRLVSLPASASLAPTWGMVSVMMILRGGLNPERMRVWVAGSTQKGGVTRSEELRLFGRLRHLHHEDSEGASPLVHPPVGNPGRAFHENILSHRLPFIPDLDDPLAFEDVEEHIHGRHMPFQELTRFESDDDRHRVGRIVDLPCIHVVRVRARHHLCHFGNLHVRFTFSRGRKGTKARSSLFRVSMPILSMNLAVLSFGFAWMR